MYVTDFIPKAFQPLKQNTGTKRWGTYTPKVFLTDKEPFLEYHFLYHGLYHSVWPGSWGNTVMYY